jgi:hypothetical protein
MAGESTKDRAYRLLRDCTITRYSVGESVLSDLMAVRPFDLRCARRSLEPSGGILGPVASTFGYEMTVGATVVLSSQRQTGRRRHSLCAQTQRRSYQDR